MIGSGFAQNALLHLELVCIAARGALLLRCRPSLRALETGTAWSAESCPVHVRVRSGRAVLAFGLPKAGAVGTCDTLGLFSEPSELALIARLADITHAIGEVETRLAVVLGRDCLCEQEKQERFEFIHL